MLMIPLPPICPFGSTEDYHLEIADPKSGSVFRIWSVTADHKMFLRICTDSDGFASYFLGPANEVIPDCLDQLKTAPPHQRRRVRRQLRRWRLDQLSIPAAT
jgi:hypothetical protein